MDRIILVEGKKFFDEYTKELLKAKDRNVADSLQLKFEHSLRVAKLSADLAKKQELETPHCELAELIGLFHDLGRFVQFTEHQTFDDSKAGDHAQLSCSLLKDQDFFLQLPEQEQQIVLFAIENHNKITVAGKDKQMLLFCHLLRDADKLDIWDICVQTLKRDGSFSLSSISFGLPNSPGISEPVIKCLVAGKPVIRKDLQSVNDFKLMLMGMAYDLNFKASFQWLNEKQLIKKLYDTLPKRDDVINVYRQLRLFIENKFVEKVQ